MPDCQLTDCPFPGATISKTTVLVLRSATDFPSPASMIDLTPAEKERKITLSYGVVVLKTETTLSYYVVAIFS